MPMFEDLLNFLNEAFLYFGDCYKSSMKNIGLDTLYNKTSMFLDNNILKNTIWLVDYLCY